MKFESLLFFITLLTFGCVQPPPQKAELIFAPADTLPVNTIRDNEPPPPPPAPKEYYLSCNFIIDTSGHTFYYQQPELPEWLLACTGDNPPVFINLHPKDIVKIPPVAMQQFIDINLLNLSISERSVSIVFNVDSVRSSALELLINSCKEKSNKIEYNLRRATQEEAVVLDYKVRQKKYDSRTIKWDSTKTFFPSKL